MVLIQLMARFLLISAVDVTPFALSLGITSLDADDEIFSINRSVPSQVIDFSVSLMIKARIHVKWNSKSDYLNVLGRDFGKVTNFISPLLNHLSVSIRFLVLFWCRQ